MICGQAAGWLLKATKNALKSGGSGISTTKSTTSTSRAKIPLSFSNHSIGLCASEKTFAIATELEWDKQDHKFTMGIAALMGGNLPVGFE